MVINSVVSGNFYVDYQGFGIPYYYSPKYNLYIRTHRASGYIEVRSNKKHSWLIGKYGYDYYT